MVTIEKKNIFKLVRNSLIISFLISVNKLMNRYMLRFLILRNNTISIKWV